MHGNTALDYETIATRLHAGPIEDGPSCPWCAGPDHLGECPEREPPWEPIRLDCPECARPSVWLPNAHVLAHVDGSAMADCWGCHAEHGPDPDRWIAQLPEDRQSAWRQLLGIFRELCECPVCGKPSWADGTLWDLAYVHLDGSGYGECFLAIERDLEKQMAEDHERRSAAEPPPVLPGSAPSGYPAAPSASWHPLPGIHTTPAATGATEGLPWRLPEEFWAARPVFQHARQAAWSRQRNPEAVLLGLLTRASAMVDPRIRIPALLGSQQNLVLLGVIVAPSGVGKSDASKIARELLPTPPSLRKEAADDQPLLADSLPTPSGQGLTEAYFGWVEETQENGRKRKVRQKVRSNAYFYLDEGKAIKTDAQSDVLLDTLRSAWSGATIGQQNASDERRRILNPLDYTLGVLIGIQEATAGRLLSRDAINDGTAQRIVWIHADRAGIPDPDHQPEWPGPLDWDPADLTAQLAAPGQALGTWIVSGKICAPASSETQPLDLRVHPDIVREIKWDDYTGKHADPLDSHLNLTRLKVACLLALVEKRVEVNPEDWRLAGMIMAASHGTRNRVLRSLNAEKQRGIVADAERQAAKEIHVQATKEKTTEMECARKIGELVWSPDYEPIGLAAMRKNKLSDRFRPSAIADRGLAIATQFLWVKEHEEQTPGNKANKKTIVRGAVPPPQS